MLAALLPSLSCAARILWKQPGFAAVAVLTLALGIGPTTAIFSVVYGVMLKPLPFHEPDRLVALYHLAPGFGGARKLPQSPASYFSYRDNARVFEDIGLWNAEDVSINRSGEPEHPSLRKLMSGVDKTQVPDDVMSLEQALAESIAPRRLNLFLFSTFAAAAIFVAMIGVYGVTAYSVTQRVHEIGIRMALGAQRTEVVSMVVRQGMQVTFAGIAAGLAGALALTQFMEGLLYEVQPSDPFTFAVLTIGLGTTGFLACCIPALRAAFIDPTITLRYE